MRRRSAAAAVGALVVFSGCGSAAPRTAPSTSAATTTVAPTTSAPPPVTMTPTTRASVSGPVPAGFKVQSATFVSVDRGWVLGTAACASPPCTSMARTDGNGRWVGVPAPLDGLSNGSSTAQTGVSEVRFADDSNGWVFGPDLWSTHDGVTTWNRVTVGSAVSQVIALETAAGEVDAVVTDCAVGSAPCPGQLWHAPIGSDQFTQVPSVQLPNGVAGPSALALHGRTGYLVANPEGTTGASSTLWATTDGTSWRSHPSPCESSTLQSVAAVDSRRATALCAGGAAAGSTAKTLYGTADGGATFTPEGSPPPRGGDGGTVVAASASDLAIATSSAAAEIYRSTDGGATWRTAVQLDDGGLGFGDFGFTDATHGFAVHAPAARVTQGGAAVGQFGPNLASLYRTNDGGGTWSPVAI